MKKKWIAEAGYIIVGLFFLGICIASGREQAPAKTFPPNELTPPGQAGTATPGVTPQGQGGTATPGATPQGQGGTATPGVTPPGQTGTVTPEPTPTEQAVTPSLVPTKSVEVTKTPDIKEIKNADYTQYDNKNEAWWFLRRADHSPSGSGEAFPIAPYSGYYRNTGVAEGDKVIYLTFDCGYENGCTPSILDTLAEENVKAMFFVTKDFVVKNPEYVKRMKEEGHLVGNHTVRHLSSPSLTPEELEAELSEVAKTVTDLTGYRLDPFFRPPMGEYSQRTLKATQDMGYSSIFWSIAYYDYDTEDQPGKDYVVDHFATYHHSGAIALMHNTSESNMQALGDVIRLLKAEGYRFGQVTEFIEQVP
ncbi:MAG: polysaccharide deacetylase family protein [Lachnospiraceae bacterium]|nr:polysaccharide deacetylase family protein [Lachnospiraceae bacterium]